jgi:hypothetical protein
MRKYLMIFFATFFMLQSSAQNIRVITLDNSRVEVEIVSDSARRNLIRDFDGKQDNSIRKQWTARSYRLTDNRILLEFYNGQAALLKSSNDLDRLRDVRFVKNYIDFLKKDISYKIEIPLQTGLALSRSSKRMNDIISESAQYFGFEVYQMQTGQVLYLGKSDHEKFAVIYQDMKALSSDNYDVLNQYYKDMDAWTEKLIQGDPLFDYETDGYLVYPKDISALIKNHRLALSESKVYVDNFYGNLYRSDKGYFVLIDDLWQKNGAGRRMGILTVRIYEHLQDVRNAQSQYLKHKKEAGRLEHFYQRISDKYGRNFPVVTNKLIDTLPDILNFDKIQFSFDAVGMAIVDEAIRWHHADYEFFNTWYPSVLAYYGQCYMTEKNDGKWIVMKDGNGDVWIPHLVLSNGEDAFDTLAFYKDLLEWPHSMKEAGDWDGQRKYLRKQMKLDE